MTVQINLEVNHNPIVTDYFVARFIDYTVSGMIQSLEGTGPVRDLKLTLDEEKIVIILNGALVPINQFVTKIMKSTLNGILSPLKGVTQPIRKIDLDIKKPAG